MVEDRLTIAELFDEVLMKLVISEESIALIEVSPSPDRIGRTNETVYGVNTGFGSLSNIRIDKMMDCINLIQPDSVACLRHREKSSG